jgi:preprotein translocase subunit SecF
MCFGIIIGTYSSIFVAASLLIWLGVKREGWTGPVTGPVAAAAAKRAKA